MKNCKMKKIFGVVILIFVLGIGIGFSYNVSAEEGLIPSWIKNTANFWVNDQISDSEFINALQFLINNGILTVEEPKAITIQDNVKTTKSLDEIEVIPRYSEEDIASMWNSPVTKFLPHPEELGESWIDDEMPPETLEGDNPDFGKIYFTNNNYEEHEIGIFHVAISKSEEYRTDRPLPAAYSEWKKHPDIPNCDLGYSPDLLEKFEVGVICYQDDIYVNISTYKPNTWENSIKGTVYLAKIILEKMN